MRRLTSLAIAILSGVLLMAAAGDRASAPTPLRPATLPVAPAVELETVATVSASMTAITHAGDNRLFLTTQQGKVLNWDGAQVLTTPFLDVSALITCCGEQGLLSTAFHPSYARNGFFFVDYTDLTGRTIVARYRVSSDPNVADPASARILLTIDQPFANHNGGQLQFGPDGFLYIGMGDGGSANDPMCNAQSSASLLGKLLRIDVDQNVDTPPYYGIPAGNPFVSTGGPDEAWAKGLRNPWRFSFDRLTGDLYIGDVGQDTREEIDYQPLTSRGGENYGWKIMEGSLCGTQGSAGCTFPTAACGDPSFTPPVLEYGHDGGKCSITGGYVYRGLEIPALYGFYVYGDFCSGQMWAAARTASAWSTQLLTPQAPNLQTFGEDFQGEVYLGTGDGILYRLREPAPVTPLIDTVTPGSGFARGSSIVTITGANFTSQTTVAFGGAHAAVTVLAPTLLTALLPPHAPGVVDVTVANPGAVPAVKTAAFTYIDIPRVTPRSMEPRVVTRPA